jgi:hypothetical protein
MLAKPNESRLKERAWTRERLLMVTASLLVISVLGFVSYHIGDNVTATTDTVPKPVNGAAPATSSSPILTSLPAKIVTIPLKDVRGPSFKLARKRLETMVGSSSDR